MDFVLTEPNSVRCNKSLMNAAVILLVVTIRWASRVCIREGVRVWRLLGTTTQRIHYPQIISGHFWMYSESYVEIATDVDTQFYLG